MHVAETPQALAAALARLGPVGLVPTMGALHAGHVALVAAARAEGPVVASVFVNPTQFGPGEDFARYPRDRDEDLARLTEAGCAVAFVPDVAAIYPPGDATTIVIGGPAEGFEGAHRPGHFNGVATVVTRLFGLVRPRTAWFGEKDWQQLQVVRRLVADLRLGVEIRALPTVRDADGLALSSRNQYLDPAQRALAASLPRHCRQAVAAIRAGGAPAEICAAARAALEALGFAVGYLTLVGATSLVAPVPAGEAARLLVAARLGPVRLLDNFPV